jgi:hypothetical protein
MGDIGGAWEELDQHCNEQPFMRAGKEGRVNGELCGGAVPKATSGAVDGATPGTGPVRITDPGGPICWGALCEPATLSGSQGSQEHWQLPDHRTGLGWVRGVLVHVQAQGMRSGMRSGQHKLRDCWYGGGTVLSGQGTHMLSKWAGRRTTAALRVCHDLGHGTRQVGIL